MITATTTETMRATTLTTTVHLRSLAAASLACSSPLRPSRKGIDASSGRLANAEPGREKIWSSSHPNSANYKTLKGSPMRYSAACQPTWWFSDQYCIGPSHPALVKLDSGFKLCCQPMTTQLLWKIDLVILKGDAVLVDLGPVLHRYKHPASQI